MLRFMSLVSVLVLVSASMAMSQVTMTIGPTIAPVGGQIVSTISNDSGGTVVIGTVGPISVSDANGVPVFFTQLFIFVAIPVPVGSTYVYYVWDQRDDFGNQVPPGLYTMSVDLNGTTTTEAIIIGGVDTGLVSLGVHRPGTTRGVFLSSPQDQGQIYAMAASLTINSGIATCGGLFPLDNDPLFAFSTTTPNGVFFNTFGLLDTQFSQTPGGTMSPLIGIPPIPTLSGFTFWVAFAVIDPTQFCPITRISNALPIMIL